MRYLLRRSAHAAFLLLGVSLLAFAFTVLAPGSYFDEMRLNPQIAPETTVALRSRYVLDRPVAGLVRSGLPLLVRHVRAAVAEVLLAPFLLAAGGHGIPRRTLLCRYALAAAANPLVALFGFSNETLLRGSLLIEVVMGWPGL